MEGYVKNKSPLWRHAMKRSFGPGHTVELDEIYDQYGKKHDLKKGMQFVDWLRRVKLRDDSIWEIVYKSSKEQSKEEEQPKSEEENVKVGDNVSPMVKKGLTVDDITSLSVRKARERLPKINDLNLLKYAHKQANQLANKDTLTRMLKKRIQELEMFRR